VIRIIVFNFSFLLAGFALAGSVFPYTPQSVNDSSGKVLRWDSKEIVVSISNSEMDTISYGVFEAIVKESFGKWAIESDLRIRFEQVSKTNVSTRKSGGDGVSLVTVAPTSENLLLFGERKTSVSAITRLFFDASGRITEADIVLNPTARFTTDGSPGSFDLEATLTHEAGHFLGLGHSGIVGATMHRHQGKNGTFALPAIYSRTLSSDDRAGIRFLYGSGTKLGERFGSLEGRLVEAQPAGLDLTGAHVWIESSVTGEVIAGIETDKMGRFSIPWVPVGTYRLIAAGRNGAFLSAQERDVVVVSRKISREEILVGANPRSERIRSYGFNGQIANIAIPLEAGHSYLIFVSGKDLDPERIRFECTSPAISVDSLTLARHYARNGQDVLSFEVNLSPGTANGEYSFRVYEGEKLISYLPGVVTVGVIKNPWYSALF